jgi:glutamyl-tRNA reductase
VRSAWLGAKADGLTGSYLDSAFMKAIHTGRKVRNETKINEGSVSISSAAIDLATQELGDLSSKKALIIGAGQAGTLVAETLQDKALSSIIIANRTHEKGLALANEISGQAINFDNILEVIPDVDLVVTAITVIQPLLKAEQFASISNKFPNDKRLLLIDISQPRAIEGKIGSIDGISLKTIEDLKKLVDSNLENRIEESKKCRGIIEKELVDFEIRQSGLIAQPIINNIYQKFEEIRKREISRALKKLKESDDKKILVLERFSRELIERIAQIPVEQLKIAALANDDEMISIAQKMFQPMGNDAPNVRERAK